MLSLRFGLCLIQSLFKGLASSWAQNIIFRLSKEDAKNTVQHLFTILRFVTLSLVSEAEMMSIGSSALGSPVFKTKGLVTELNLDLEPHSATDSSHLEFCSLYQFGRMYSLSVTIASLSRLHLFFSTRPSRQIVLI